MSGERGAVAARVMGAVAEVRVVTTAAEMEAVRRVRRLVFIEEQAVPEELEWDEFDAVARHFCLCLAGAVVGTARLVLKEGGVGKIGRVAVLREFRGGGCGAVLMRHVMADARALGCGELALDAQVSVIPFYERLGFAAEGDEFLDAGILHRHMRRPVEE
jgi:predicted GNAT family N-acyltransferase